MLCSASVMWCFPSINDFEQYVISNWVPLSIPFHIFNPTHNQRHAGKTLITITFPILNWKRCNNVYTTERNIWWVNVLTVFGRAASSASFTASSSCSRLTTPLSLRMASCNTECIITILLYVPCHELYLLLNTINCWGTAIHGDAFSSVIFSLSCHLRCG